jgi:hypothetical protein
MPHGANLHLAHMCRLGVHAVPLQSAMALFTNGNPYRRHLQNDMPIRESSIKCIDSTNNSRIGFSIARQQH